MKPLTIFLPTYNRPEYAREALASCLRQTYPHFRIVMSDDTPSDAVRKVVEAAGSDKIEYRQNVPALGLIKKLDWFLDHCATEWAVMLGDDDWLEPEYLATMARMIEKYPDASLVRTRCRVVNPKGDLLKIDNAEKEEMTPFEAFGSYFKPWYKIQINISGTLFKPSLVREAGGFPHYYQGYHVDQLAWARMTLYGRTIFAQEPLISLRRFDESAMSSQFDPDYVQFLETKVTVLRDIRAIYDELWKRAGADGDRAELRKGWKNVETHFTDCVNFYMNQLFVEQLKKRSGAADGVRDAAERMRRTGIKTAKRFKYLEAIAPLPYLPRRAALSAYRKGRHLLEKLFPPETFQADR